MEAHLHRQILEIGLLPDVVAQVEVAVIDQALGDHQVVGLVAGQLDAAAEEFREAIRLDPNYAEPHNNLASVFGRQGNIEEAIDEYRKAIEAEIEPFKGLLLGVFFFTVGMPAVIASFVVSTAAHFAAQVGQRVKVETSLPVGDRRRFTGTLLAVENGEVVVDVDGQPWRLPLAGIARARVVPVW